MKVCNRCGETKDNEDFYKDKTKKDHLTTQCKKCIKIRDSKNLKPRPDRGVFKCTRCKQNKTNEEFHSDKYSKNGLSSWCKKCKNETSNSLLNIRSNGWSLYLILCKELNVFKVGITSQKMERRFNQIQSSFPFKLKLEHNYFYDDSNHEYEIRVLERELHLKLDDYRIRVNGILTEWFQLNKKTKVIYKRFLNDIR